MASLQVQERAQDLSQRFFNKMCSLLVFNLLRTCCKVVELNTQVVPTSCYRPEIQQFLNKLQVITL